MLKGTCNIADTHEVHITLSQAFKWEYNAIILLRFLWELMIRLCGIFWNSE